MMMPRVFIDAYEVPVVECSLSPAADENGTIRLSAHGGKWLTAIGEPQTSLEWRHIEEDNGRYVVSWRLEISRIMVPDSLCIWCGGYHSKLERCGATT